jgi:hypothetical protein
MALILKYTETPDFNSVSSTGGPNKSKTLQVFDTETNEAIFSFNHASDGTATAEVDAAQCVTDDTVAVKKATVTLTNAQIKTLPTTDVEIVAAPTQPNRILHLIGAYVLCDSRAGAYTNLGSSGGGITSLEISGGGSTGLNAPKMADINAWLGGNRRFGAFIPRMSVFDADDVDVTTTYALAGQAYSGMVTGNITSEPFGRNIEVYATNYTNEFGSDLGNFTGGHADNSMRVTVLYVEIDV